MRVFNLRNSGKSADVDQIGLLSKKRRKASGPARRTALKVASHVSRVAHTAVHRWQDEKP